MTDVERSEFLCLDEVAAHLLATAYDQAVASMAEASLDPISAKRIRDLIAMKIVECAREGERDPQKLKQSALDAVTNVRKYEAPSTLNRQGVGHGSERAPPLLDNPKATS